MNTTRKLAATALVEQLLAEAPTGLSAEFSKLGWRPTRDGRLSREVALDDGEAVVTIDLTDGSVSADVTGSLEYETRRGPRAKEVKFDPIYVDREAGESDADFADRASSEVLDAVSKLSIELDVDDGAASDSDLYVKDHPLDRF